MINNYKCPDCKKYEICKWNDKLKVFTDDVKTPIDIDLDMKMCPEYDEVV